MVFDPSGALLQIVCMVGLRGNAGKFHIVAKILDELGFPAFEIIFDGGVHESGQALGTVSAIISVAKAVS